MNKVKALYRKSAKNFIKEYMNIGDTEYAIAAIMSLITVYGGRQ